MSVRNCGHLVGISSHEHIMLSPHLRVNLSTLRSFKRKNSEEIAEIIDAGSYSLIYAICEIVVNLLKETIICSPFVKDRLKEYRDKLTTLVFRKKFSKGCKAEKEIINRYAGSNGFLNLTLPFALKYINKVSRKRRSRKS